VGISGHIDITLTDILEESGFYYMALMKLVPVLEDVGVIKMTRRIWNAKTYQVDRDSGIANSW
jgi:hypothetical protein